MTTLTRSLPDNKQNQPSLVQRIMLWVLFLCVEASFLQLLPEMVVGPILAVLLLYTYFILEKTVLVTVIIVIANDALGTIIGGSLSYQYLLLIFIFFEVFTYKKVSVRSMILGAVAALLCGQLCFTGDLAFRLAFFTVLAAISLMVQYTKHHDKKEEFFDELCTSLAIILSLISIHALITGGVEYYELNEYSEEFLRKGILGAGSGDSNFSGLFLCTGIVGALNSKKFTRLVKAGLVVLMIAAMTVTVSITGLLALVLILLFHFAANQKAYKAIAIILLIVLLLVVLYNVYVSLPSSSRIDTVDAYIDRITETLDELEGGNLIDATSNRSRILTKYVRYITTEQSEFKMLFGGNGVRVTGGVPHNTYIDWALQFGIIGLIVLLVMIVKRFIGACRLTADVPYKKLLITMKLLYFVYAFSLSIYNGAMFSTLFFFVFFL